MNIVWSIAGWLLGTLLIAAGMAYLGDSLYIRHEVAGANSAAAFGNVRFYYATKLRNGKYTIYQDSPQNEVCVHALFPHYGYKPCWFASRNTVRVVAGAARYAVVDFPRKNSLSGKMGIGTLLTNWTNSFHATSVNFNRFLHRSAVP